MSFFVRHRTLLVNLVMPKITYLLPFLLVLVAPKLSASETDQSGPFTASMVRLEHPRLLADGERFSRIGESPSAEQTAFMNLLRRTGEEMLPLEPVSRTLVGYRLLFQSRSALKRISTWALLYRVEGDPRFLERARREIEAAIGFADWNPRHYLDVGEMTLAVAIGIDWLWDDLDPALRAEALEAIRTKGLLPSLDGTHPYNWWLHDDNNWNPVCNAGLIAGSLLLAESHPDLAESVINRALRIVPNALAATDPDGVYLEGPTYWGYGTTFTAILIELLQSATGTSFGLAEHPSFQDSLDFRVMCVGPSGQFYNFYDNSTQVSFSPTLSWFAQTYGNPFAQFEANRLLAQFLANPDWTPAEDNHRLLALQALWFPDPSASVADASSLPTHWFGGGDNALSIIRENWTDPDAFYLAYKAGYGQISHAHMDAGSFVFEDDGVRWAIDLGAQYYNSFESLGLYIWDRRQHSDRWRAFRLGSYSHNILLVDERPQSVTGIARLSVDHSNPAQISGTIDLTDVYIDQCTSYTREIIAHDFNVIEIIDRIQGARASVGRQGRSPATLHWRMVTNAHIDLQQSSATLSQNGKSLHVEVLQPSSFSLRQASLEQPSTFWDAPNPNTRSLDLWTHASPDGHQTVSILLSTDRDALQALKAQRAQAGASRH